MKRKVTTIKSGTCIYIKVVHGLIRSYRRVCCVEPSSPIPSLKMHLLFEVKMPWRYVLLCQISHVLAHQIGISVVFKHLFNALYMLSVKLVYESSVVQEKSQPSGPPFTSVMDSIYLTCPYQPKGKIKKKKQPHVSRTLAARRFVTSL